jgi:hypothetical protein
MTTKTSGVVIIKESFELADLYVNSSLLFWYNPTTKAKIFDDYHRPDNLSF